MYEAATGTPLLFTKLPPNSGHITAGEVERTNELIDCIAGMEREYRDALNDGDGNMPDWVRHRINPLDPRYNKCTEERCVEPMCTCGYFTDFGEDNKPCVDPPACAAPALETDEQRLARLIEERRVLTEYTFEQQQKLRENRLAIATLRRKMPPEETLHAPAKTNPHWRMNRPEGNPSAFHALLDETRAIHDAKNKDYADSADALRNFRDCEEWGLSADRGCFTRIGDKMMRLKNLMRREFLDEDGPAVREESVEDTALDAAIYLMIFVLLRRERRAKGAE